MQYLLFAVLKILWIFVLDLMKFKMAKEKIFTSCETFDFFFSFWFYSTRGENFLHILYITSTLLEYITYPLKSNMTFTNTLWVLLYKVCVCVCVPTCMHACVCTYMYLKKSKRFTMLIIQFLHMHVLSRFCCVWLFVTL